MSSAEEKARKKQIIVGLVMGVVIGVIIGYLTGFWWWLAAGVVVGFATGVIMKPPEQKGK